MEASITVRQASLSLPIFLQRERNVRGWTGMFLGAAFDPPHREMIRLLHDINFDAGEGDRVAIVGRNGAGKSTLLRVLNGVYAPSEGSVEMRGSCQAMLNLALGFSNEATVRENIFLRGTAMGLRIKDLRSHVDEILDFAELHEKSNHRLRTLSAGQKMRLGFAITTSVQTDILLMDEWVGAGDSEFRKKATERMHSRVGGSKIVMLASHSTSLLRDVCNKGLLLEGGRLLHAGDIVSTLHAYHELLARLRAEAIAAEGEEAQAESAYGAVEVLTVDSGTVFMQGWCVSQSGIPANGLVMDLGGQRHVAHTILRYPRPDVVAHMGLSQGECGYRAEFAVPGIESVADLGQVLSVLAGDSVDGDLAPLRIAPTVRAMLRA